ncbi:MAG: VWA domain-containing protein [Bryobacterales bacterium]|nr:VWA domain-containing protein [Bryobacterales bacterium]
MFFANLSALEFLALFSAAAGVTVALYLLIRARKRFAVATLRFWQNAQQQVQQTRRRRIDQPWSLLLQLLAIALLLLAIAQPRLGSPDTSGRDHILILDSSAWQQNAAVFSESKKLALEWLSRVPPQDRVMLVRADALATPATRFEADPGAVRKAIEATQASSSALDLQPAFDLSLQALRLEARRPGEILYTGPGRIEPNATINAPANLRVLLTKEAPANIGLTRVELRRSTEDATLFHTSVTARNYSDTARNVPLIAGLGGALISNQLLVLPPNAETTATFQFRMTAAGWLETRLSTRDALPSDNRVTLEIPEPRRLRVNVYTTEAELLRPILSSDVRIQPTFLAPSQYQPNADADLFLIDSFQPLKAPERPAIFLNPGAAETTISSWSGAHPIAAGIRTRDLKIANARILTAGKGETVIASAKEGALIVAGAKTVTLGFHPLRSNLRYSLATPLLFANIFQWIAPETFLRQEVLAATPGAVSVELAEAYAPEKLRVLDAEGAALPFTVEGRSLRFFAATPSTVRVLSPNSELTFALTLPGLGATQWQPPVAIARGLAAPAAATALPKELWQYLALLAALLLGIEWWLFRNQPTSPLSLALKVAAIAAAVISVFQPDLSVQETKMAVAVLPDTSASISGADLETASRLTSAIDGARGRNIVRVLPFARSIRTTTPQEFASGWKLRGTGGEAGRATSLEAAIREASAAMPSGMVPRLVLISDGKENSGSVARAAWQARQLGIPIDTYALAGRAEPRLQLDSVRLPTVAFTGERFPIEITVQSPEKATGTLELTGEGKALGASPIALEPGLNNLRVTASLATPGAIDLVLNLRTATLGDLRFQQAVNLRRPRLLYLSQDPAGMESHLFGTLNAAQFEVVSNVSFADARFEDYQVVLFNNWDMEAIAPYRKAEIERFVQQGGGLMVIGGEHNVYVEKKQPQLDALDRVLPATIAPPRSPEGAALVLIVDKSSSMEGRKMELARLAAIGVVENLRPIDHVGVLIFDNSHQWAIPIRRAEDKTMMKRLISGITPDGGTQIAPALAEGYKKILPATGAYKHIVLLTDGISEEGDSIPLAKEAALNRITISTVGLGQDVNRAYLEKVALNAKGKAYFLTDPSGLEQILLKDVMEHTGSTTVEKNIQPKVVRQAEILEGLPMETAPVLKGYVRFQAKPTAETLLSITSAATGEKDDPLLTRWQYGLGRSAVFTSDAKTRWAAAWVTWPGYDKFWANVVRDLLPHAQPGQTTLTHDAANGLLVADYRFSAGLPAPAAPPAIFAIGPDGFQAPLRLERLSADHFRATVAIANRKGLFRVRPLAESRVFPEVGLYLPEPEITTYGSNPLLLQQLSAYTGGRYNPTAKQVFDPAGRSIPSTMRLWPGLLAAALILNLLELAWRRLRSTGVRRAAVGG